MLTLHNVATPAKALHYFSQDNYYTEDQGLEESTWFGKGAETLGLSGKVDKAAFLDTLDGKVGGAELGKWVRNADTGVLERDHRPATDLTFSAPKSVSLLAEVFGAADVRQAHEEAVHTALVYVERELAATRHMQDGALQVVRTGNLVAALFQHTTSRELDPQTHTHAIVMNATQRPDGQWRSLSNDEIYQATKVVAAIYNADLADRLQRLGYELRRTDSRGNFEINGISREQIEQFSQRRAEIAAAMAARGIDITGATREQREAAALSTRARKHAVDHDALVDSWRQRAKEAGVDFAAIADLAASNRERGGVSRADRLSGRNALEFAAAHLIEREAVVSKGDLIKTAVEHGTGRVSPHEINEAFTQLEQDGRLVLLPDGMYTSAKMLGSEMWTEEQMRATKRQAERILGPETTRQRLGAIEAQQGFTFTQGQSESIVMALSSHDRFVAVQGLAGTGKTRMLAGLHELAREQGYVVRGMAPTGVASKTLTRETGIQSDTVAMFQIKERKLQKDIAFAKQYAPGFQRQKELWVVDESSFLSQRQKEQLDLMAIRAGAKVVYLGDTLQLQGVEAGKPFEMAQRAGAETAHMTQIGRQKTEELKTAVGIITGQDLVAKKLPSTVALNHNARALAFMDKAGMVREVQGGDVIGAMSRDLLAMDKAERERTLVITPFNRDRLAINEAVRGGLRDLGELGPVEHPMEIYTTKGWTRAAIKETQYYAPGDIVRFGRDYRAIDAAKGEYMRVLQVDAEHGRTVLERADGGQIVWSPSKHNIVEVYESEQRTLSTGDLIRFTRNDGQYKNGEVATITALKGNVAAIEMRGEHDVSRQEIDFSRYRHWEHAYASTVHASQGVTQHRTIFHIPTVIDADGDRPDPKLLAMAQVFGDRSFYVASTRASHELRIYTDDKAAAAKAVTGKQEKSSAVEALGRKEISTPSIGEQGGMSR